MNQWKLIPTNVSIKGNIFTFKTELGYILKFNLLHAIFVDPYTVYKDGKADFTITMTIKGLEVKKLPHAKSLDAIKKITDKQDIDNYWRTMEYASHV